MTRPDSALPRNHTPTEQKMGAAGATKEDFMDEAWNHYDGEPDFVEAAGELWDSRHPDNVQLENARLFLEQQAERLRPPLQPVIERCVPKDGRNHAIQNGHHSAALCCAVHRGFPSSEQKVRVVK